MTEKKGEITLVKSIFMLHICNAKHNIIFFHKTYFINHENQKLRMKIRSFVCIYFKAHLSNMPEKIP